MSSRGPCQCQAVCGSENENLSCVSASDFLRCLESHVAALNDPFAE